MITLRQTRGFHRERELSFESARVRIGRLDDNDLCFDPVEDLDVSGRHAEIHQAGGGCLLVDVGSLNGTWVNGKRIEQAVLKEGDEIDFGQHGPRLLVTFVSENSDLKSKTFSDETPGQARSTTLTDPMPQPAFAYLPTLDRIKSAVPRTRIPTLPPVYSATPSWKSVLLWSVAVLGVLSVVAGFMRYFQGPRAGAPDAVTLNAELIRVLREQASQIVSLQVGEVGSADFGKTLCLGIPVGPSVVATTAQCVEALARNCSDTNKRCFALTKQTAILITQFWRHPRHSAGDTLYDAGLIRLAQPISTPMLIANADEIDKALKEQQFFVVLGDTVAVQFQDTKTDKAGGDSPFANRAGDALFNAQGHVVAMRGNQSLAFDIPPFRGYAVDMRRATEMLVSVGPD